MLPLWGGLHRLQRPPTCIRRGITARTSASTTRHICLRHTRRPPWTMIVSPASSVACLACMTSPP